jgi:hypothetical protein
MFQFVVVSHPDEVKGKELQDRIRQHSIRSGIRKSKAAKGRREKDSGKAPSGCSTQKTITYDAVRSINIIQPPSISINLMDPFDSLCASSKRLHSLLKHRTCSRPFWHSRTI